MDDAHGFPSPLRANKTWRPVPSTRSATTLARHGAMAGYMDATWLPPSSEEEEEPECSGLVDYGHADFWTEARGS